MLPSTGENTLRIHIPTGADLTPARLQESIQMADAFLQTFFPAYASANMYCNSWLLSPALKALLPDTSRIRQFQNAFIIEKTDPDAQDYLTWVYRCPTFPSPSLEALPEQTSLQKAMKQYLLRGGKIGTGYGRLKGF